MTRPGALWTLSWKEIKILARDGHTIIYSILLPLFLYPGLVWGISQASAYVQGLEDRSTSRALLLVAASPQPSPADEAVASLKGALEGNKLEVEIAGPSMSLSREDLEREVREGRYDAVVELEGGAGPLESLDVRVVHTTARSESVQARRRFDAAMKDLRRSRLESAAASVGDASTLLDTIELEEVDVTTPEELTSWVASMVLPIVLILMGALGALYPALEVGVGEKERGTLETTLLLPVSKVALATGKLISVVCFSFLSFSLNLASMIFTLSHLDAQAKLGVMNLSLSSLLVVGAVGLILSASMAPFMLVLGFLARSFKEGQSYISGIYLVISVLAAFSGSRSVQLDASTAFVPVLNLALLVREGLRGRAPTSIMVVAFGASIFYGVLLVFVASRMIHRAAGPNISGRGVRGTGSPVEEKEAPRVGQ